MVQSPYLGKYLALFETGIGFYAMTSEDAIHWQNPKMVMEFPKRHSERESGDTWYSYPTLLSPDRSSDRETGQIGYLYYSKGDWNTSPHLMHRRPFTLE